MEEEAAAEEAERIRLEEEAEEERMRLEQEAELERIRLEEEAAAAEAEHRRIAQEKAVENMKRLLKRNVFVLKEKLLLLQPKHRKNWKKRKELER